MKLFWLTTIADHAVVQCCLSGCYQSHGRMDLTILENATNEGLQQMSKREDR